jgi:hypothetical protein
LSKNTGNGVYNAISRPAAHAVGVRYSGSAAGIRGQNGKNPRKSPAFCPGDFSAKPSSYSIGYRFTEEVARSK